jgi:hypothetical protein
MYGSVSVVGVNLDGEFFGWKNKFHQQREIAWLGKICATPLGGHLAPGFSKSFSCEWAISNAAIYVREPSFADWFGQIRFFGIEWSE